jgi:phage tail sheath gpL-like
MAIDSLRDGFVRLCFDPNANVLGERCRLVLEGQMTATGTATADQLVKVTSARDLDAMFGEGSVIGESLKVAINCCGNDAVEIFAVPRDDAATAVAAEYTLTIVGPATTDGRLDFYWGDSQWNISVRVADGDDETTIAAAIVAALPTGFPYTAVALAGVITLTARNAGTAGNFLNGIVNWHQRNDYMPEGVTATFAQTVDGETDPAPLDYSAVFGDCCLCCWALLTGDEVWQDGMVDFLNEAWSCDKPQCFGHGYTYNSGSLGEILASDTNSATISRLAHCDTDSNFPWLKVAAYAAKSCCLTVDNPEISIQGPNYGVLDCIRAPESCSSCFTFDEQEQLRDSGFVVTVPVSGGSGGLTSPMITNDITNNRFDAEGRENLTFQSVSSRRLATETATLIAEQLQQFNGLGYYTDGTNIREGALGVNRRMMLGTMRAWVKTQVGALFSQFDDLDRDLTFTDDFEVAPRCQGVPGKLYMNLIYRPPVRIRQVVVNAVPKLLNNC